MENVQHSSKKNEIIWDGYGISGGVTSLISGILFIVLKGFLYEPFKFDYFLITYIIIAIITCISIFCTGYYLIAGLVLTVVSFIMSIINAFLFIFTEYWKFWNVWFSIIYLLFVINLVLIGIYMGNLIKNLKNK